MITDGRPHLFATEPASPDGAGRPPQPSRPPTLPWPAAAVAKAAVCRLGDLSQSVGTDGHPRTRSQTIRACRANAGSRR